MRPDIGAFLISVFFISGASLAAVGLHLSIFPIGIVFSTAVFLFAGKKLRLRPLFSVVLFVSLLSGSFYFHLRDITPIHSENDPVAGEYKVISFPDRKDSSVVYEAEPVSGDKSIYIRTRAYPSFSYGDVLYIEGKVSKETSGRMVVEYPKISVRKNEGSDLLLFIYGIRERLNEGLKRSLSSESAALAAGILLGDKSGFSPAMWDDFRETGTTHLVALSGFNIAVVAWFAGLVFAGFGRRARYISVLVIVSLFVLMAGAGASAVRAAIMGSLMLMAKGVGRETGMRNVITSSALLMVLWDPSVVVSDIGFELSFLAVIGIIYLSPFLRRFSGIREERSLPAVLVDTISAEVMVMPLILIRFGSVSWYSVIVNVAVIGSVPLTMAFSFAAAIAGLVPGPISAIVGFLASLLLRYELETIHLFAVIF